MTHIARSALVPYTPMEMFALVADIPSYPQFLPWCGGARILSRDEDLVVASIDIAYKGVHKPFTTRNRMLSGKLLEMSLVEGPFKHLHGNWQFLPVGEDACRVAFDLDFEVANRLLAVVINPVFTSIANQMVDGFVVRAKAVYGTRGA